MSDVPRATLPFEFEGRSIFDGGYTPWDLVGAATLDVACARELAETRRNATTQSMFKHALRRRSRIMQWALESDEEDA